jgi:hypothetical protein
MSRIDPLQMAQFFALPGAAELVEAFSAIPPGELRDSAVTHVQVIARHCGWIADAPFGAGQPERLAPAAPKRLASPFTEDLKSASAEGQIIERALRGEASASIAADLGSSVGLVERLKNKARKEGGLEFPGDAIVKPGNAKTKSKAKGDPRKGRKLEGVPIPPPPYWWEDPASPIWDNPKLLPTLSVKAEGSMAGIGPLDSRSHTTMSNAAARHNMTLRQYIAQRYEVLRRIDAGEKPVKVSIDMRISAFQVYGLLAKVGRSLMSEAQSAHYAAEAKALLGRDDEAQEPTPEPVKASLLPPSKPGNKNGPASAQAARIIAAKKWGFKSLEAYEASRIEVRDLRLKGHGPKAIAEQMKQSVEFVRAAMSYWRGLGVEWPEPMWTAKEQEAA